MSILPHPVKLPHERRTKVPLKHALENVSLTNDRFLADIVDYKTVAPKKIRALPVPDRIIKAHDRQRLERVYINRFAPQKSLRRYQRDKTPDKTFEMKVFTNKRPSFTHTPNSKRKNQANTCITPDSRIRKKLHLSESTLDNSLFEKQEVSTPTMFISPVRLINTADSKKRPKSSARDSMKRTYSEYTSDEINGKAEKIDYTPIIERRNKMLSKKQERVKQPPKFIKMKESECRELQRFIDDDVAPNHLFLTRQMEKRSRKRANSAKEKQKRKILLSVERLYSNSKADRKAVEAFKQREMREEQGMHDLQTQNMQEALLSDTRKQRLKPPITLQEQWQEIKNAR
ncbi:hypothetical protein PCE1_000227 [Barthelona sp. PCE]